MGGESVQFGRSREDVIGGLEDFLQRNVDEPSVGKEGPGFLYQIGKETTDYWGDFWRKLWGAGRKIRPERKDEEFSGESIQLRRERDYSVFPEWGGENIRLMDRIMEED